jgi:S1-C subfamily serine protease
VSAYLQTDVVMYPGFSGGALIDAEGNVLGLNTSGLLRGASIALPAETIRESVSILIQHGHVRRGFLGVAAQPVRLPHAIAEKLGQETGLLLLSVEPDGPADRAGLMLGDTLGQVGGAPARQMDDLLGALGPEAVDQTVVARILRGGELREVQVRIGERK